MSETNVDDLSFSKMKVAELKAELKKRGLSMDGKKNELIERLQTSIGDSALLDDSQDDLLDEDVLSDEEVLGIDTPPELNTPTNVNKRPIEEDEKRHPKKVILNRKVVEAIEPPSLTSPEVPETNVTKSDEEVPAKFTKISVSSQQEKLALRAARFGSTDKTINAVVTAKTTEEPKLEQKEGLKTANTTINEDVLKKRAQRFGAVAPILEKVQLEEKMKIRLNRFGGNKTDNGKITISSDKSVGAVDDKKAIRAARFQT